MILRHSYPAALLLAAVFSAHAADCPRTSIEPTSVPATGTVGVDYLQTFTATNTNASPFTWSITSGLPDGLSIKATTGQFTGRPSQVGSYLFTVTATDATGCSGGRTYPLSVAQGSQTIAFTSTAPVGAQVGSTYEAAASATSNLPVTLTIDAAAASVCSIAGSTVTLDAVGNCTIDANQAGDANWGAAPLVQQTFGVGKTDQTISFTSTAPANAAVAGAAYAVSATATSNLAVTFSIDASAAGVCAITGGSVTFQVAGTCVIDADQAGDATYGPAPQVQQSFIVNKGDQSITFVSPVPPAMVGGTAYVVAATATSLLPVTYTIDPVSSAVCTIAGTSVTFTAAGTCTIDANQPGDANWNAAPQAQQNIAVDRGAQTVSITSTAPAAQVNGPEYTVVASASSGLPVRVTVDPVSGAICTGSGASISFQRVGICVVDVDQLGDANWLAAPQQQQSVVVGKGDQVITFGDPSPSAAVGENYGVSAIATSRQPVTFAIDSSTASNCTLSVVGGGDNVHFDHAADCTINAMQAGDANWNPATAQQTIDVVPGTEVIVNTSAPPPDPRNHGPSYTVTAVSRSGRPVRFFIDPADTACALSGADTVNFIGTGTCEIAAFVDPDADWGGAMARLSFAVGKGSQTITITSAVPTLATIGGTYTVTATATSGLPVVFSTAPGPGQPCSTSSAGVVTFTGVGQCFILAEQSGDANWDAAPQAFQTVDVTDCVTLAVGQVLKGGMPGSSNFCIANGGAAAQDFVYLPINNSLVNDTALSLAASGIQAVVGPPSPRPAEGPLAPAPATVDASSPTGAHPDFDAFPAGYAITAADRIDPSKPAGTKTIPTGPLAVGQLVDINGNLAGCTGTPSVRKGRVEYITTPQSAGQAVLYVVQEVVETTAGAGDWHPPIANGYTLQDLKNIVDAVVQSPPGAVPAGSGGTTVQLKTGALDLHKTYFGAPADVDNNGGLVVFFTKAVNELATRGQGVQAQDVFLQRDLMSTATCPMSNQGEIIYMPVPDPTGVVNGNVRTWSTTYNAAVASFLHGLSHLTLASRRLYVNNATAFEEQWLDESLTWMMQELVFFNTSVGLAPRGNSTLASITSGPNASVRITAFNMYENILFGAADAYFYQLGNFNGQRRFGPLRTKLQGTPTSQETIQQNFSTQALFLRYAIDRKNTGDVPLLFALANATLTGRANLQAVLGADLDDWARDFLVAAYTDDAVSGIAPQYSMPSWNYRSVYNGLGGFKLAVDSLTTSPATFDTTLGTGGGTRYVRFGIAAGGKATLALTQGGGAPGSDITMALVRTK